MKSGFSYPWGSTIRNPPLEGYMSYTAPATKRTLLALPFEQGIQVLDLSHLVRIEADGCYTNLFLSNQQVLCFAKTLKFFGETLTMHPQFVRIHRSHMINLHYLKTLWRKGQPQAELSDGTRLPVARRRFAEVLKSVEG